MIRNNTNIIFSDNSILEKLSNCPFLLEFIQNSDFDNLTKYVQSILDNCNQNVPDCTQMLNVLRLNTRRRISSSILEPVKQIKTVDSSEKFVRLSSDVLEQTILKGYSDHEYFEASEWMKKLSAGDIEVNVDNFDHLLEYLDWCLCIDRKYEENKQNGSCNREKLDLFYSAYKNGLILRLKEKLNE